MHTCNPTLHLRERLSPPETTNSKKDVLTVPQIPCRWSQDHARKIKLYYLLLRCCLVTTLINKEKEFRFNYFHQISFGDLG